MDSSGDGVNFRSLQEDSIVDPFLVEALHNPRHRLTILRMELDIQRFLDIPDQQQFEFQYFPTSYLRLAAYRVSHLYGLQTLVQDSGLDGQGNKIVVRKTVESKYPTIQLSEIPVKQSENDKSEQIKIVLRHRPNKANVTEISGAGMKSTVRSVEERKEEYDRARARIFSSSSRLDLSNTSFQVPTDGKNLSLSKEENESFRNSMIDPEKILNINDLCTSSRVAIFRDREKDRTDPDYDRSYDRYVRSLPANQRFNMAPFSMQKFQPQFLHYEVGLSQLPRTLAPISYRAHSTPAMTPFCAMGLSQTSREATYIQCPCAAMLYAHPYDQFRQTVVQFWYQSWTSSSQVQAPAKDPHLTMDLAALAKTIEGLAAQIGHLETRIQDQAVASDQRLAAIEASIQNEEESVGGGSRMQSRRNVHRQAVRNNNGQDGHDPEEKALKSIKVEAPNFDGLLNAKVCLDWISDMDHYFDWYELSETQRVQFAKMKLVGKAREWWSGVERRAARAGDEPITHWEEMKERLKEKYVPLAYKERLLDRWQSLRQGNMTAAEYIDKFEEFMVRCNINEDPSVTLARFRTGLRPELQRELIPHEVYSLERAYQIVLELERYLKTPTTVHSRSDQENPEFRPSSSGTAPSPFVNSSSTANSLVKADTGKGVQSGVRGGGSVKCYKCLGHGHYAGQCPTKEKPRSLFAASTGKEAREELEEEVYIPEIPAVDDDLEDEPIAQIQPRTAVVRCTLTQPKAVEDWKRTSIFHTYVKYGDRSYKVIIDNGSCVNIVSPPTISNLGLTPADHPQPYHVAWIDKCSIPVTKRCQVPIQFSSYKDTVWCDVVPMDVGHILLGRPWLYDLDVTISGRSNSCSFIHEGKHIKLNPIQPKPVLQLPCKGGQREKSLNIIVPRDLVENIVDEQVVSTRQGGYQKYSIKWKEKPDSDKEELQHTNPDILERYYSFISPEVSSSQPGRIDEDIIVKPFKVYERNKWKEKTPNHSR